MDLAGLWIFRLNHLRDLELMYRKYTRQDQRSLAIWAAACAERVLPLFEEAYPEDDRPRKAVAECRTWVRTGVFHMAQIRGASLSAHAAARKAKKNGDDAACFAARAAGQAVGTAHVSQHAYGGAYYALKATAAANPVDAEARTVKEREWQSRHLPTKLRRQIMSRITVEKAKAGVVVRIQKGKGF